MANNDNRSRAIALAERTFRIDLSAKDLEAVKNVQKVLSSESIEDVIELVLITGLAEAISEAMALSEEIEKLNQSPGAPGFQRV